MVYFNTSNITKLCVLRKFDAENKYLMDPATIGLLISIAPTVLELLFGGSVIKHETLLENPEKMYGYGLEGYGLEGYGYRYPPIQGYSEQGMELGTVKKGPRKGMTIKRYPPLIDERWVAAYLLNKQIAGKNKWREYATKALQQASDEYFNKEILPLRDKNPEAFARALQNRIRKRKKDKLPLALRSPHGQSIYNRLLQYKDDTAKLREIYYGKPKKERKRKALTADEIQEIIKEYEGLQLEVPVAKK
jgi:hypothetical protein